MRNTTFFSFLTLFFSSIAWAEEASKIVGQVNVGDAISHTPLYAIGAGMAIGAAALGGALGQGKIGAAAMDGIARNPQAQKTMFVPMVLGLVLIESLVIYALVISFQLAGAYKDILGL